VQDRDGEGQIVYLFLPFYRRGNLQDVMNSNSVNGTHFPEREILRLFRGTCLAVRAMHTYRSAKASSSPNRPTRTIAPPSRGPSPTPALGTIIQSNHDLEDEQHENEGLLQRADDDNDGGHGAHPHPDDEGEGEGFTYAGSNILLPTRTRKMETRPSDVIFDHDEFASAEAPLVEGELIPFAHRDLKPA
jgi:serine/threonine kinase 16